MSDSGIPVHTTNNRSNDSLRGWERGLLIGLLLTSIAFGVLVEIRSAFLSHRRTDLGAYLRAGWAIRVGADIYDIPDDCDWHYSYPPLFAIVMVPLADAPTGAPRQWMLPFAVSVAVCYLASLAALAIAVHWTASVLGPESRFSRTWWYRRIIPIYVLGAPIGSTLSRGQVNLLLLALLAGWFAAQVSGRRFTSGLWLAAAVCLKLIPGYLLLLPLWRRDLRALAGFGTGMAVGFGILPALVWGPDDALVVNLRFIDAVVLPGIGAGGDSTRDTELMEVTATDNQSFQAILHNYRHWGERRPPRPDGSTKAAHCLLAAGLTLTTLLAGRRVDADPARLLVLVGSLTILVVEISPVSHLHYPCLGLFLVMGLRELSARGRPGAVSSDPVTRLVLVLASICFALPMIPYWDGRREAGLPMIGVLILWAAGMVQLVRTSGSSSIRSVEPAEDLTDRSHP